MDSDILAFFAQKIWPNEGSVKKKALQMKSTI